MDSAVREISSSAPAQASVETRANPPNAMAPRTIACRRVGALASASRFVLSLIVDRMQNFQNRATTNAHQWTRMKCQTEEKEAARSPEPAKGLKRAILCSECKINLDSAARFCNKKYYITARWK